MWTIPGNRNIPVSDESLVAINRLRWSPGGQFLTAVVAPTYEALEVILVSADGRVLPPSPASLAPLL